MNTQHELSFLPIDEHEHHEFETVVHDFVALEANKPPEQASAIFASYDRPSGRWQLSFETHAALQAFRRHWSQRAMGRSLGRAANGNDIDGARAQS